MQLSALGPLSPAAHRFRMQGADPHLPRLPSRAQPANNAASVGPPNEQCHKGTLIRSPALLSSVLLLLGVRGDENEWEENVYVFMISQSSAVSRSETVSAHDGRLEGRWNLHWQEHSLPRFTHFCFGSVGGCMSKQPE